MKKYFFITLFTFACVLLNAQVNEKYLAGAVPETDGKVVFTRTIGVNTGISDTKLFEQVQEWAQRKYNHGNNRVLLVDSEDKEIACRGESNLVFKKNAFVLDQAVMSYQLVLKVNQAKCEAIIRNVRYKYSGDENFTAEESISDKEALNGKKLHRYYGKFRMHTVDSVAALFNSLQTYLASVNNTAAPVAQPVVQQSNVVEVIPATPLVPATPAVTSQPSPGGMPGFKQTTADKIPGNYIKLLSNWTLIASGKSGKQNVMTASWGGIGVMWEKPVAMCFLNPTRYSVTTMDEGDTYTISFYTEAYKDAMQYCGSYSGRNTDKIKGSGLTPITTPSGALAFSEAWMILECRKVLAQPVSADAVVDKSLSAQWSKDGYHKMYIGEILNVWIK